jgi:hypothetical protein
LHQCFQSVDYFHFKILLCIRWLHHQNAPLWIFELSQNGDHGLRQLQDRSFNHLQMFNSLKRLTC